MPEDVKTEPPVKPEEDLDIEDALDHSEKIISECKKEGKLWYKSKVVWANVLALILIGGTYLLGFPQYAEVGGVLVAVANLGLRAITREALRK